MSDRRLYMLEPRSPGAEWAPFAGVRPVAELRAGVWRIRERWEGILHAETVAILGDHCPGFFEGAEPPVSAAGPVEGPAIVAASWFAPSGEPLELDEGTARLTHEGLTVAWIVGEGDTWEGEHEEGDAQEIDGLVLHGAYDLLTALEHLLPADCADFLATRGDDLPGGSIVIGEPSEVAIFGGFVEPGVVFDTRHGAIVIEEGAQVRGGSRLEGPLYIGPQSWVLGGDVKGSVLGPHCRVRGEVSSCLFLAYVNKAHDGFVGHSVFGAWVNLGAGTITSNLKNTYGPVRLEAGGIRIETERQFLGSLVADHAKTAIGTLLGTGTIIGAGANVFGGPAPKWVRPFAWGVAGADRVTEDGFLTTAGRVLPRRQVELTTERAESLRAMYRRSTGP
ncbi:MAG TPA: putative sugar nucleotidyl transferase [Gemmatimonadales bacterium]|nr:putative sugar nucleotidyl transferase [Gemmatimonadales bacterium]